MEKFACYTDNGKIDKIVSVLEAYLPNLQVESTFELASSQIKD